MSATTRRPRPGEAQGVDYHFLSDAEFERRVQAGEFVEHAWYSGPPLRDAAQRARVAAGRRPSGRAGDRGPGRAPDPRGDARGRPDLHRPAERGGAARAPRRPRDGRSRAGRGAARHRARGARGAAASSPTSWSTTGSRTRRTRSRTASARTSRPRARRRRAEPVVARRPVSDAPLHGEELAPEDERLLRGPPPAAALRWCERAAGARVATVRALTGGTSSAVHAVDLDDGRALVLRRFVRAGWLAEEPDIAAREAAALALVRDRPVPAPRLVAVDVSGAEAGTPAVLTERLPGAVVWRPPALEPWLRGLAALLPAIHATPVARRRRCRTTSRTRSRPARRRPGRAGRTSGSARSPASTARRRRARAASSTATSTRATCSGPAAPSPAWSTGRARSSATRTRTSGTAAGTWRGSTGRRPRTASWS